MWWSVILPNLKGWECNYPILPLMTKIVTHPFNYMRWYYIYSIHVSIFSYGMVACIRYILICVRLNLVWKGECIYWMHDKFSPFTHNITHISFELRDMILVQKMGKWFQFKKKVCNSACNMVCVTITELNKVSLRGKNKIWLDKSSYFLTLYYDELQPPPPCLPWTF